MHALHFLMMKTWGWHRGGRRVATRALVPGSVPGRPGWVDRVSVDDAGNTLVAIVHQLSASHTPSTTHIPIHCPALRPQWRRWTSRASSHLFPLADAKHQGRRWNLNRSHIHCSAHHPAVSSTTFPTKARNCRTSPPRPVPLLSLTHLTNPAIDLHRGPARCPPPLRSSQQQR